MSDSTLKSSFMSVKSAHIELFHTYLVSAQVLMVYTMTA